MYTCAGQRTTLGALPQDPYSLTFKAGYFLEQRLTDTARLAHQRAPGILLLYLPRAGIMTEH